MVEQQKTLKNPLRVLIVEDSPVDRRILESMLAESSDANSFQKSTDTLAGAMRLLNESKFDLVILDLNLPDSQGEETLMQLNRGHPDVAIVINTGAYEDELGLETLSFGAQDFLVKGKYTAYLLNKVIRYAVERKRLEMELKEAYDRLKETQSQLIQAEKMKVVGGLASGVAHEVKNPLATILYGVTYLSEHLNVDDAKIKSVLENIKQAVDTSNTIITNLLDFASLNKLDKKKENLNTVLERTLALIQHEVDKRRIEVTKKFDQAIPEINIDRNRIEQVLVNLILNAVYALSDNGKVELKTYCQTLSDESAAALSPHISGFESQQTVVVFEVEDNGEGIPEDKMDKIFDPFFTTRRGSGGVGLGLSVSKNIMDNHGGKIRIENKREGGVRARLIFKVD